MTVLPADYRERVYAGWLGKCIGVRLGSPVENWTAQEIADNLGEVSDFLPLPPGTVFQPDDDTAVPLILVRALQDYGPDVTAEQIGETLLNYLGDQRGTLWWGGYGISTEHTAYLNLAHGIPAPRSGSIAHNGKTVAEQIGGQIFSDLWGLVAPNNPKLAAELAARASSVTHDGEGVHGGRFIAALVSRAFGTSDPVALVETGLTVIPAESEYARVTRSMLGFYRAHPDDWRAAYAYLKQEFGYDRYPGVVHMIPNAGVVVMALLYGAGDLTRSVCIATNAGWDTDCNAGNVGAIMGVAVGLDGIEARWRSAMNDVLVAASVIGSHNLLDIPGCADLFGRQGERIAGIESTPRPRYHFDYRDSTHGFGADVELGQVFLRSACEGCLQVHLRELQKKGQARVFVRTYYRPDELSGNFYGASFSPLIVPGQTIYARVCLPESAPLGVQASLFVWDDYGHVAHQSQAVLLKPGEWQTLSFGLPPLENVLLSQVGLVLHSTGRAWTGNIKVDSLDWSGEPAISTDFRYERNEFGAISGWTFLRGFWRMEDGAFHGSGAQVSEAYTGDAAWRDYTLAVDLVPVMGDWHNVLVRVQGARRSYVAGLAPGNQIVLQKNDCGYHPVAAAPLLWEHGRQYSLQVRVSGAELAVAVDGRELLRWTDLAQPYLNGQIGVGNVAAHTCVKRLMLTRNES